MNSEENILGYEKISKLMLKFSIPTIISLVVNSLYNIVDQIFIGRGVGYLGNGATNVVFPITVLAMGFAFMIGDGGAAYLSLKLGQQKKDEAAKGVANSIIIGLIVSVVLIIFGLWYLVAFKEDKDRGTVLCLVYKCKNRLRKGDIKDGQKIFNSDKKWIFGIST